MCPSVGNCASQPAGRRLLQGPGQFPGMARLSDSSPFSLCGHEPAPEEVIWTSWQGDMIAHGGVASALDSSTCVAGGLIRYTVADGAKSLPISSSLPLVVGQAFVADRSTAKRNTTVTPIQAWS